MVERLTPIIKGIKQNIIKDTKVNHKTIGRREISSHSNSIKEMVIMVMERETTVMERKTLIYFLLKRETRTAFLFFLNSLTSNYMLIKSSWHS
jgi:hypothetical protein